MKKLMVLIHDRISDFVSKGEITARYYNPGGFFGEVHLCLLNDDKPDLSQVQKMAGEARLVIMNFPVPKSLFLWTLGWRPWLLKGWAKPLVRHAEKFRPQVIRCHGNHLNAFAASEIKRILGIPYAVSLHLNSDEDNLRRLKGWRQKLIWALAGSVQSRGLLDANRVLPVYQPIVPYLQRIGVKNFEVAYNVLNPGNLTPKKEYRLSDPVRVISVGRIIAEKFPLELVKACAKIDRILLTVVGDGPMRASLVSYVESNRLTEKVRFLPSVSNDELCRLLPQQDIFATHTEYWELSKSILEALLTGLPVLLNKRRGPPVPELTPDIALLVDNSESGFLRGLTSLIEDDSFRQALGTKAYKVARERWSPERTERNFVRIYSEIIAGTSRTLHLP